MFNAWRMAYISGLVDKNEKTMCHNAVNAQKQKVRILFAAQSWMEHFQVHVIRVVFACFRMNKYIWRMENVS